MEHHLNLLRRLYDISMHEDVLNDFINLLASFHNYIINLIVTLWS